MAVDFVIVGGFFIGEAGMMSRGESAGDDMPTVWRLIDIFSV